MKWWLAVAALAACADDGGPRLDTVTPSSAQRGATVVLAGRGLCGAQGDCMRASGHIQLGLTPPYSQATVLSLSATSAQIVVPAAAPVGATAIVATIDDRSSNALDFEVLP